jgi:hypothetical protein
MRVAAARKVLVENGSVRGLRVDLKVSFVLNWARTPSPSRPELSGRHLTAGLRAFPAGSVDIPAAYREHRGAAATA